MKRSYIKNFKKGKEIAEFIDSLMPNEIKELINDVIKNDPISFDIFPFNRGEKVLISASVYLKKLDKNRRKLINEQIEALLKAYLKKTGEPNAEKYMNNLLTLHSILGIPMSERLADTIINAPKLSKKLKTYTANALASLNDNVPCSYWENINISEKPFLASAVITALTKDSPENALLKLKDLERADIDITTLVYPTKKAVRNLIRKPTELRKVFYTLKSGGTMRKFFEKILSLKEFPDNLLKTITSDDVEEKFYYIGQGLSKLRYSQKPVYECHPAYLPPNFQSPALSTVY